MALVSLSSSINYWFTGKQGMDKVFHFSVETYNGNEGHILDLLKKNRAEAHDKNYLNWRYLGEKIGISPVIFFVKSNDQKIIGMTSYIFRTYWSGNEKIIMAIGGDTSLNKEFRGTGAAKGLFDLKTSYIREKEDICALGLGTPPVVKLNSKAGYQTGEQLADYTYLIDYVPKLLEILKIRFLSNMLGGLLKRFNKIKINKARTDGYRLFDVDKFDSSFDSFWSDFDKTGLITRDRSILTLRWRYEKHPYIKFNISKIYKNDNFIGYIIYSIDNRNIIVFDLIFQKKAFAKDAIILFIKKNMTRKDVNSIKIPLLSENHLYIPILKKIGFINRGISGVIQYYCPHKSIDLHNKKWFITLGDKDI